MVESMGLKILFTLIILGFLGGLFTFALDIIASPSVAIGWLFHKLGFKGIKKMSEFDTSISFFFGFLIWLWAIFVCIAFVWKHDFTVVFTTKSFRIVIDVWLLFIFFKAMSGIHLREEMKEEEKRNAEFQESMEQEYEKGIHDDFNEEEESG